MRRSVSICIGTGWSVGLYHCVSYCLILFLSRPVGLTCYALSNKASFLLFFYLCLSMTVRLFPSGTHCSSEIKRSPPRNENKKHDVWFLIDVIILPLSPHQRHGLHEPDDGSARTKANASRWIFKQSAWNQRHQFQQQPQVRFVVAKT